MDHTLRVNGHERWQLHTDELSRKGHEELEGQKPALPGLKKPWHLETAVLTAPDDKASLCARGLEALGENPKHQKQQPPGRVCRCIRKKSQAIDEKSGALLQKAVLRTGKRSQLPALELPMLGSSMM